MQNQCSGCGEIIDDKNVFCPKCGAKKEVADEEKEDSAVASEEVIPEGKRKCSGCGEIIDDSDMFCANCGTKKEDK